MLKVYPLGGKVEKNVYNQQGWLDNARLVGWLYLFSRSGAKH
jgi:hypothetical protein